MRLSLRFKLALLAFIFLFVPFGGKYFSEILQQDLIESRRQTIQFSAKVIAAALSEQPEIFAREGFHSLDAERDLYLYQLTSPIRLNGKADDWYPQVEEAAWYGRNHLLQAVAPYEESSLHFRQLTGSRGNFLYILFLVTDDHLVYRSPHSPSFQQADHLRLSIADRQGEIQQYIIAPVRKGWVNGMHVFQEIDGTEQLRIESSIRGMWEETEQGYTVELRLPVELVGNRLAFSVADVDDVDSGKIVSLVGTGTLEQESQSGLLIPPSASIEKKLQAFSRPDSRITIVDRNQHIRARYGKLSTGGENQGKQQTSLLTRLSIEFHKLFTPLYQFFTKPFLQQIAEQKVQPKTVTISGISKVLQEGVSTTTSYTLQDELVEIMAAISPLAWNDDILGAVIVEQTTASILALQNRVIEESLTLSIILFSLGGASLIIYATRLSWRIRSLGRQAAAAISETGRIHHTIHPSSTNDEIGDLSKTLDCMLSQLKTHMEFREKMADNLEHELRTPLAGISASLKNLASELKHLPDNTAKYLQWALSDVERVERLLATIRDAASLQQALAKDQKEDFALDRAIELWLSHYWRPTFAKVNFKFQISAPGIMFRGDPDRIQQMLDKLVENAVSFHEPGTPIEIKLSRDSDSIHLSVANRGPAIPEKMRRQIFDTMVSHRSGSSSQPHLGLGLYIVRTIVQQYGGEISVNSFEDGSGAIFSLAFSCRQ